VPVRPSLMCILAHPDDETLGLGSTIAKACAEGIPVDLVCATRGERGWTGAPEANPGEQALGVIREAELRAAATVLGLRRVDFLDYVDGDLDQADPREATARIVAHLRRARPAVVVTFGPDGSYGHPDHVAISQLTTSALLCAADPAFVDPEDRPAHRVAKLYYIALSAGLRDTYWAAFGDVAIEVDGVRREAVVWPDWAITAWVDGSDHWRTVWRAVTCHRSQIPHLDDLAALPEDRQRALWGVRMYYRAASLVGGGRAVERDLFAGLR